MWSWLRPLPAMPLTAAEPLLPVDPEAESWCDDWLAEHVAPAGARPLALITPGAGWGAKRWPPERYAAVAQGLKDRGIQRAGERRSRRRIAGRAHHGGRRRDSRHGDASAADRAHAPHRSLHWRRHRAAASGLRSWPAGGGHLRADRSQPQRALRHTRPRAAQPRAAAATTPAAMQPEPGLLTITPEDVLRAADELLAEERAS